LTDTTKAQDRTWDRRTLNEELFRRPPVPVGESALIVHAAFLQTAEQADRSLARLREMLAATELANPTDHRNYEVIPFGDKRLKWERHNEFTSYTLVTRLDRGGPFRADTAGDLPGNWLERIEGQQMAGTKICLVPESDTTARDQAVAALQSSGISGLVADGGARVWADYDIYPDGCTRIVLEDRGAPPDRRSRVVQRLVEIETYRMMAMLGFPPAKEVMGELQGLESDLRGLVARVADEDTAQDPEADEATLHELLTLASEIERLSAVNAYRFDASQAYYDIVQQRIEELRETRVEGCQRLSNFLRRRLGPAMQTVQAVARRLETLSGHINHTASLIRTRVDLRVQRQNRSLLHSMDRRAALQLRLQQTLEWLTVAAISYYGIGVVQYIAEAVAELGAPVKPALVAGAAAPFVIGGAYWLVTRVRRILRENDAVGGTS
jgi:uncharacterized membrane-anchored protein